MKIGMARKILQLVSSGEGIRILEEMAVRQGKTASKLVKMATSKVAKGSKVTVSTADEVLEGYARNAEGFAAVNPSHAKLIEKSVSEAAQARVGFGIKEAEFSEWLTRHGKKVGVSVPKYSGGAKQLAQESRIISGKQERQRVVQGWRPDNPYFDELKK